MVINLFQLAGDVVRLPAETLRINAGDLFSVTARV
jgi:hypothetical protein